MLTALIVALGLLLVVVGAGAGGFGVVGTRLSGRPGCVALAATSRRAGLRLALLGVYFAVGALATTALIQLLVNALGAE